MYNIHNSLKSGNNILVITIKKARKKYFFLYIIEAAKYITEYNLIIFNKLVLFTN